MSDKISFSGVRRNMAVALNDLIELGYNDTGRISKGLRVYENDHHGLLIKDFGDDIVYVHEKYDIQQKPSVLEETIKK